MKEQLHGVATPLLPLVQMNEKQFNEYFEKHIESMFKN
jgi:hypothetical protein